MLFHENLVPPALRLLSTRAWPESSFELPRLQAHRGLWNAGFQENTLDAFRAARAADFRMCELDARLSRDDQAVVFHDETLDRLVVGRERRARDLTAAELWSQARAPRLSDVLADAGVTDFLNIEIKAPVSIAGKVEPVVARVIREARAENRVMISSFNPFTLSLMAQLLPEVPRALIATDRKEAGNFWLLRKLAFAPLLDLHAIHLHDPMLTPELISYFKQKQIRYAVWTVNDRERANELLDKGAASVITDRLRPGADLF